MPSSAQLIQPLASSHNCLPSLVRYIRPLPYPSGLLPVTLLLDNDAPSWGAALHPYVRHTS